MIKIHFVIIVCPKLFVDMNQCHTFLLQFEDTFINCCNNVSKYSPHKAKSKRYKELEQIKTKDNEVVYILDKMVIKSFGLSIQNMFYTNEFS